VGDSGIRIDGVHLLQDETPVDRITSALRTEVVGHLVRAGADAVARAAVARACVLYGLGELHPGMAPWIDAAALGRLREASVARACSSFAAAPTAEIRALVERGVVGGQSAYANAVRPPLGYGVIDGFEVPSAFVRVETRAAASVNSIELFTDGYFRLAEAPSPSSARIPKRSALTPPPRAPSGASGLTTAPWSSRRSRARVPRAYGSSRRRAPCATRFRSRERRSRTRRRHSPIYPASSSSRRSLMAYRSCARTTSK
jgi:hypothetical protein